MNFFFADRRHSFASIKKYFNDRIHWGDKDGRACVRPPLECRNYTWKECSDCYHADPQTYLCCVECGKKDARYVGPDAVTFREDGVMSEQAGQGKRNDLEDMKEAIKSGSDMMSVMERFPSAWRHLNAVKLYKSLHESNFDPTERILRDVRILYGPAGSFKSSWARKYMSEKGWSVYIPQMNNGNKMSFESYNGQVCLILFL